jgi:hypothetical protein
MTSTTTSAGGVNPAATRRGKSNGKSRRTSQRTRSSALQKRKSEKVPTLKKRVGAPATDGREARSFAALRMTVWVVAMRGRLAQLWFLGGAEEDFADEGLGGGGQDHFDGVGDVGGLKHLGAIFFA